MSILTSNGARSRRTRPMQEPTVVKVHGMN
jgi:hypothetical protein